MKKKGIVIVFATTMFCLASTFAGAQQVIEQKVTTAIISDKFTQATKWLNQSNLSLTTSPNQAFMNDYIMVTGEGVPAADAKTPGQKRLTAERAATVVAYRQLAEILDGLCVAGDTYVRNASVQYDVVRTAVTGFIKGAQVIHKEYNEQEEIALVIVKVGMGGPDGFGSLMYSRILGDPGIKKGLVEDKPSYTPKAPVVEDVFDGLIIDATSENFRPALINRIFNPGGELLYDPSKINQKVLVEYGCGEYTNKVEKAKEALASRGVKNPMVIKAAGTITPSDLKVSEEDALKIFSSNQKTGFLSQARVAFVLK